MTSSISGIKPLHRSHTRAASAQGLRRRDVLRLSLLAAASQIWAPALKGAAPGKPLFTGYPFTLGVASGYPTPHSVVLWTRLAPEPLQPDGGMLPQNMEVAYELANDPAFAKVQARGKAVAVPELAHSVRVEAEGLAPDRWYWYRFRCGDEVSRVGRTRTTPAPMQPTDRLRMGIGSCQHFEHGYFAAHRHLAREELDCMLFLGDYIYESSWGDGWVRRHAGGTARTLAGYRQRHAQYKTDSDLQDLHATVPWLFAWDDHEVENDYAADQSEHLDPRFAARRMAAYQAYFEHLPLPRSMRPIGNHMRMHAQFAFGNLVNGLLLDDRQYRDPQPCPPATKGGGSHTVRERDCPDLQAARTMLGAEQERWVEECLSRSKARWNVIAQQTLMAPLDATPGPDRSWWTDGWDGYPAARQRLLDAFSRHAVPNPLVFSGDLHATVIAEIPSDPQKLDRDVLAAEFCGTSLTAQGWPPDTYVPHRRANPHLHHIDSARRGYLVCDLSHRECQVRVRHLRDEKRRDSDVAQTLRYAVEPGSAKIHPG